MKKNLLIFAAVLLFSVTGYVGYYHYATAGTASMLCGAEGEMEWLKQEFKLTDYQFQKIMSLHAAYRPKCDRMCAKIAEARTKLDALINTNKSVTSDVELAFKNYALVEEECQQAMLGHIYEVSALMPPESRNRYVEKMKRYILHTDSHPMMMHQGH